MLLWTYFQWKNLRNYSIVSGYGIANIPPPLNRFTCKRCYRKKSLKTKEHNANLVVLGWLEEQCLSNTTNINSICCGPDSLSRGKEQADKMISRLRKSLGESRRQGQFEASLLCISRILLRVVIAFCFRQFANFSLIVQHARASF